jgi:dienelactone hydrolase
MTAPTLILIGEANDWNTAAQCRNMVAHKRPDSAPLELVVYPGADHAFDVKLLQPGRRGYQNHWLEYNELAAKDAKKTRAFLAAHLAAASRSEPTPK